MTQAAPTSRMGIQVADYKVEIQRDGPWLLAPVRQTNG